MGSLKFSGDFNGLPKSKRDFTHRLVLVALEPPVGQQPVDPDLRLRTTPLSSKDPVEIPVGLYCFLGFTTPRIHPRLMGRRTQRRRAGRGHKGIGK
jgi:hypothetical protein